MSTRAMITLPRAESDLLMLPASCEFVRRREGGREREREEEMEEVNAYTHVERGGSKMAVLPSV